MKKWLIALLIIILTATVVSMPFAGNPVTRFKHYFAVKEYLDNKYNYTFTNLEIRYDWYTTGYHALSKVNEFPEIGTFKIIINKDNSYRDYLCEAVWHAELNESFIAQGKALFNTDVKAEAVVMTDDTYHYVPSYADMLKGNHSIIANVSIDKTYSPKDLADIYKLIESAREFKVNHMFINFEGGVSFMLTDNSIYDIKTHQDILKYQR
ncbi:MAG: hypothetical protein IJ435_09990 [Clostridia bacterium]|nr:hypothetical protein [Clostridia bacterium]